MLNNANPKFRQSIINAGQEFQNTKHAKAAYQNDSSMQNADIRGGPEMSEDEEDSEIDEDIERKPFSPMENQQPEVTF